MSSPLRVGVAGLGTVGAALVGDLGARAPAIARAAGREIVVTAVSARDPTRERGLDLAGAAWCDDPVSLAARTDVDVVAELVGGEGGAALALAEAALAAGKPLVTANKAMLANRGEDLARAAEARGLTLGFEASIAGGVPVVATLREALAGDEVTRVSGILNGTCNYILTRMEAEGITFAACLADAQRLGYAEAEPSADVDGHDTAHKLALLTTLAFGTRPDLGGVHVEGIAGVTPLDLKMADELGFRVKLLGVAERREGGIEQRVHPTMVGKSAPLAAVGGVTNAVTIETEALGALTLVGPGAGGRATAAAVLADLIALARGRDGPVFGRPAASLVPAGRLPMGRHEGGYYVRLDTLDRPGAAASIAGRMAGHGISLESILQKGGARVSSGSVPVVLITYATTEAGIRAALDEVVADGHIAATPQLIRIERD